MSILASNGTIQKAYSVPAEEVRTAITEVCQENGHHLGTVSIDQNRYELTTKRTSFNWGTAITFTLTPSSSGTDVRVDYDSSPGAPKALLDGRKNAKATERFLSDLDTKI